MSIKIAKTNKRLSSHAGLILARQGLVRSKLESHVDSCLPVLTSGTSRSYKKFSDLVLGLVAGADCLDDMERLSFDEGFVEVCDGSVYTPKSYGNFLRSFDLVMLRNCQEKLMEFAFEARRQCLPDNSEFIFDMDSTSNQQYGKRTEGVSKNYEFIDCLDTLDVFDQFGFQYSIDVRAGGTNTSLGSELVIHKLMKTLSHVKSKYSKTVKTLFRGDSGYYTSGFINACVAKGADVLLAVKRDKHYFRQIVGQIHNWQSFDVEDEERIITKDGRECEIGSTLFRPQKMAQRLRYVVMRAKKEPHPLFPDDVEYDYFPFCTTYSKENVSNVDVIKLYRKRGNAENFIRENKYGLDMKHYPCLKLNANRSYALIAAFAYNIMRLMAMMDNPEKPVYAKNIRFKWINLPCSVARTGREIVFRYMEHHYKEVCRWLEKIKHLQFEYG